MIEKGYRKLSMRRYHNKLLSNNARYLITIVFFICVLHLFACTTHEAASLDDTNNCDQILRGMRLGSEEVVVEYQEVWYYEPCVKVYYIEEEKWGMYGLEQDEAIAEKMALNHLDLGEDEHVVYLQIYDYQVSDYIVEYLYTIKDDYVVNSYITILERDGTCWGNIKNDDWGEWGIEAIKYDIENADKGGFFFNPWTYEPGYMVHDVNEDGYPDVYNIGMSLYLWDNGEYKSYNMEEGRSLWLDRRERTNADIREKEEWEAYISTYADSISLEEDNGNKITYLQFHDISHADKINEQIKDAVEERRNEGLDVSLSEVIYMEEEYLVLFMYTLVPDNYDELGPIYNDSRYLTFDLSTGDLVTLDDILGEDHTREDIEQLMWNAYERKMEEVPDQYSEFLFDEFGLNAFKRHEEALLEAEEGQYKPMFENFMQYYCTDEGVVIVYGRETVYPMHYRLDERLSVIEGNDVVEMLCPWEEITLDK